MAIVYTYRYTGAQNSGTIIGFDKHVSRDLVFIFVHRSLTCFNTHTRRIYSDKTIRFIETTSNAKLTGIEDSVSVFIYVTIGNIGRLTIDI